MRHSHQAAICSACGSRRDRAGLRRLAAFLLAGILNGCAALTNPVADGVPVRYVPPEVLSGTRDAEHQVPLNLLRQNPPPVYRLAGGDVLGVWIEGVTGPEGETPPVHFPERAALRFPERSDLPPALGFPFLIREDGTVSLPQVPPVSVQGMTLAEAESAIRNAYVRAKVLEPRAQIRLVVTLMRPRFSHVLVLRHDLLQNAFNATLNNNFVVTNVGAMNGETELIGSNNTGAGYVVDLPAYENDVLNALALTGGLPGTNAVNEVVIYRGYFKGDQDGAALKQRLEALGPGALPPEPAGPGGEVLHIPLRLRPGEAPAFRPEDILLRSGDVVFVEARPVCTFYTAGLLPPGEHILPRDYDLDVVEAIARVRGPLVNGAFGGSNLSGNLIQSGVGNPNPSLLTVLRRTPGGGRVPIRVDLNEALRHPRESIVVQPGDVLILQETPSEALVRYFTQNFNFTLISRVIGTRTSRTQGIISTSGQGIVNISNP